jgi:hypothetical protein
MDFGSQEFDNTAVQRATKVTITAETQGAKVEFTLPTLHSGDYQALPAFITPLPETLFSFSVANTFASTLRCTLLISARPKCRTKRRTAFSPV